MNTEQLQAKLASLFADGARWPHDGRRLVFWYDPEGAFRDAAAELRVPDVEVLELADTPFATKRTVLARHPDRNFLLYAPFARPAPQENWLLDLEKAGLSFSADRAAMLLEELGLHRRELEAYLRSHLRYFESRKRLEALLAMSVPPDADEAGMRSAMMCALLGLKTPDPDAAVRHVLGDGLVEDENRAWAELGKFFTPDEFWALARERVGYAEPAGTAPTLRRLLVRLSVSHLARSLTGPTPAALEELLIPGNAPYAFVENWLHHAHDGPRWAELGRAVADDLRVTEHLSGMSPDFFRDAQTFEAVDRELIRATAQALLAPSPDLARLRAWTAGRRTAVWFERYAAHYQALDAAIDLIELKNRYPHGIHGTAAELWSEYQSTLHKLDRAYRRFVVAHERVEGEVLHALSDLVEGLYSRWFLDTLGEAWSDALPDGRWDLPGARAQRQFFATNVVPVLARSDRDKVFVIVSDALRYEVAAELSEAIARELRGELQLEAQLATLPSITKVGMAALLPGARLELVDGKVLRDSKPTASTADRDSILRGAAGVSAAALKASELLAMTVEEGRQAVLPHRVVYVYHDVIDATGDDMKTERGVMEACGKAIEDLVRLVKRICNGLNGTNVIVTADHGFLFQRSAIEQHEKLAMPSGDDVSESGRRHALGKGLEQQPGTLRYVLDWDNGGRQVLIPRGTLRFIMAGGGARYVHGGVALQEACVPVLTYRHQRATKGDDGPSRKVGVQLNAGHRRVTNNRFTVSLVQEEPVEGRVRSRQVSVSMHDPATGALLTELKRVELASTSAQPTDREVRVTLTLTGAAPTAGKLVVRDLEDGATVLEDTWSINLAISNDFGDL